MYNRYVNEQINAFERQQREQQAEMHRMAKLIESDRPNSWVHLRSVLQSALARMAAPTRLRKTRAAHERS